MTAVLRQMKEKWPSAHRILDLVEKAWHPKSTSNGAMESPRPVEVDVDGLMFDLTGHESCDLQAKDLFPFPSDTFPRLHALDGDIYKFGSESEPQHDPSFTGNIDWIYDEFSFENIDVLQFG